MQRIFNPSQYRSSNLTVLNKENFARIMSESIMKAINSQESPVKEKHVRKLLIGSYQVESGSFFWQYLPEIRLKENQIVCWKFCHVLHKMLRDGHRQVLSSSYERRKTLLDCGNMWRHVEDGYGQLIFKYCTLLYNRINFLVRNPRFPNDLKVSDEQLEEIGEGDINVFFQLSCEIFDALEDILKLQELVLTTLDAKKSNSMTSSGQCSLAPLVACIQDSSLLYDYSVKILFKLHSNLPLMTLEGHRERFLCLHKSLRNFYLNASNLQYFKTLIQIPHLPSRAPNFLIASDIQQHVTPQVVVISNIEGQSPDQLSNLSEGNGQLLVDLSVDDTESVVSHSADFVSLEGDIPISTSLDQDNTNQDHLASVSILLEDNNELAQKLSQLETDLARLNNELDAKKSLLLTTKDSLEKELESLKLSHSEQLSAKDLEIANLKRELLNLKQQSNESKNTIEKITCDYSRAKHDSEISQEAMKKLVRDLNDLKKANEALRKQSNTPVVIKPDVALKELSDKVQELKLQLDQKDSQNQEWAKEREVLLEAKTRLERQLDANQEDLLMAGMNETDTIIKEATKRIEELNEKYKRFDTGVKLQVNEKISEVCSNLMKAVRNLILHSRFLQNEIVSNNGLTSSADFYKRNSTWTEGLISAAKVVALAARSLVDSADRTMSGQGKFSELAAAANEIAAATAQLVVASRVKANKDSENLKKLMSVAKQVNLCTGNVVDTARVCSELIEQEVENIDINALSLHQTKRLEMETQVRLLELEDQLSKERIKLGLLRRRHYEQEEEEDTLVVSDKASDN